MVIGFDGSRAFIKNKTGTENYSYQLLKALSKIDRKNDYIIYLRPGISGVGKWPSNFQFKTISWPRLWTQAGLAIQTFKDPIEVLFVSAHTLPLIRRSGLKTVLSVHDLGAEYLPRMHQLKQALYLKWMTKFQLKTTTRLIAVSQATKDDLVKKVGCDPQKIRVVYEGYNSKQFKVQNHKFKVGTLVNSLRPYYLFVGTIQPRKNLERLIKAYQMYLARGSAGFPPSLVLVGSRGWLSDKIYKLPKKLGIEDKVKFLGYVSNHNLNDLYQGAIALTFPSLFEGFGLPILEAQACGCPVITSNLSSMPEVAGQGAILVDPYNINEIANAMIEVIDKNVRARLIKNGLENVKRFSWEKCARETLEVLDEAKL